MLWWMRCEFKNKCNRKTSFQISLLFMDYSRQVDELKRGYIDHIEEESEMEAYVICSNGPDIADFASCVSFTFETSCSVFLHFC